MNIALAPFIVEGILALICAVIGLLLWKARKPYGKVRIIIHVFFFAWLTMGYMFIFLGGIKAPSALMIPVVFIGVALLVQLVAGISMLASKEAGKTLPRVHGVSAIVMIAADIGALIMTALR
ncbi:MAG: hypothetical protein M0001_02705 [Treponema sp.]|nr:hypothetical protein [Treponema sp.]